MINIAAVENKTATSVIRRVSGSATMSALLATALLTLAGCGQPTSDVKSPEVSEQTDEDVTDKAAVTDDIIVVTAARSFDQAVTKMRGEIAAHQLVIVNEAPFQQMLGMVGIWAEPMMGFEIFHPRYGKIIYEKDLAALKEAPLRILVFSSGGETTFEYRKPSAVFAPYSGLGGMGRELDQAFAEIVKNATK